MTIQELGPEVYGELPDADTNGIHDLLFDTRDYTRRIHWWIRLFGVVWLTTMALGVVVGLGLIALGASTANKFNDVSKDLRSSSYSSRSACMTAPETTTAQCQAWFPN